MKKERSNIQLSSYDDILGNDALQIRKKYQDYVAENISLEILKERYPYQRELLDQLAELMVDSNLQREEILPSERAWAFKMKLDAMKHQGERRDLTSTRVVEKLSVDRVGEDNGMSRENVRRYIRFTNLDPELLQLVDDKLMGFNPAVELSYLNPEQQKDLLSAIDYAQAIPSLSQAQRIKKFALNGEITQEGMNIILSEEKKQDLDRVTLKHDTLKKYFPKSYTPKQMEDTIIKLLEQWQRKREREMSR
jgi:ParB family chromosome partitioning protein